MQTDTTFLANTSHIVGWYMLRSLAHPVTCCCVLLLFVAQSLKPVKFLSELLPSFLLFRYRRSVAQQCCPFAQLFQDCWSHTRAKMAIEFNFTKSYGLHPSHDALQTAFNIYTAVGWGRAGKFKIDICFCHISPKSYRIFWHPHS